MSRDDDAIGDSPGLYYAPTAFEKIHAKRAELDAAIEAGTISVEDARAELQKFKSLQIAHYREHGSEPKP